MRNLFCLHAGCTRTAFGCGMLRPATRSRCARVEWPGKPEEHGFGVSSWRALTSMPVLYLSTIRSTRKLPLAQQLCYYHLYIIDSEEVLTARYPSLLQFAFLPERWWQGYHAPAGRSPPPATLPSGDARVRQKRHKKTASL